MTLGLTPSVVQIDEAEKCNLVITGTQTHLNCILTFCIAPFFFPLRMAIELMLMVIRESFKSPMSCRTFFLSVCSHEEKQQ